MKELSIIQDLFNIAALAVIVFTCIVLLTLVFTSAGKVVINYYFKRKKEEEIYEQQCDERVQGKAETKTASGIRR